VRLGVNVPNFGPGTNPDVLRRWALTAEGLGFDLLMVSDHVVVTPDVAEQYPAPFYEPFTTIARMAANLNDLSGGRLVLGVGVGWATQEFDALGVAFRDRGRLTDEHLTAIREAWRGEQDYRSGQIPVWIGGNSDAALRRAVRLGDAWHPLRFTPGWLAEAAGRLETVAGQHQRPRPALMPRIALRLTQAPVTGDTRLAGHGTIDQIAADLEQLRLLGADTTVLDPFNGDLRELSHPETAWRALAAVADRWAP
jgi:alkanesulfonate monooxygenase SsuD/methylene tetrahydromethanopterin reductase-like flavin-dependent oxidoreductase (luciferase family)